MSGLFGYNQSPQRPAFGIQDQMVANTQQGVPLPYLAGTRKVAATWISPVYNLKAVPAGGGGKKGGGKGGKGGGGGATGTYNYFGTVAGALCVGPVAGLRSIILNGSEVWPGGTAWALGLSITAGQLYVYDAQTWICLVSHVSSLANAPGNATYWSQYNFSPTTEAFDDITIPVQGATTSGKSKNAAGGPSTYGTLRFYWGKPGQAQDANLAAAGNDAGDDHPAYQGICYIVLIDFWFGSGTTTAPNLEFVLTRIPQQDIITGAPATLSDGQACLAAVAAEVLTDQNMLGQPSGLIDAPTWNAAAAILDNQNRLYAGSVLMDTQDTLRSFLDALTQMTDNFVRYNPATGLIEMGVYQHGVTPTAGTYSTLESDQLAERPKLTNEGWTAVKSRCVVRFTDRTLAYQDNTDKADDPRAFFVLQEHRSLNVDRPYICRASQAIAHGAETLRTAGRPIMTGELTVRREFGRTIRAGDYVLVDIDIEPNVITLFAFFRVTQRMIPPTGPIKLSVVGDNTLSPVNWTNSLPPIVPVQTNVPQITTARIMESPYGLSNSAWKVICLALRPTGLISGFHVYWDTSDDEGSYVTLGGQTTFAANATLSADFEATDTTINVTVPDQLDGDLFTMQPGTHGANNDELLLFLVSVQTPANTVGEDSNGYAIVECCSVSASTLVSPGNYQLTVLRGRLGTVAGTWVSGAGPNLEIWIVPRSSLVEYTHAEFPSMVSGYSLATAVQPTSYFRITPYTYIAELLLSDATAIPFVFPFRSYAAPKLTLTSPASVPVTVTSPTYPYTLSVAGTWTSSNDNLVSWAVTLEKSTDTAARKIGSAVFAATDSTDFSLNAILEAAGSYVLTLIAKDANGLTTTEVINITATGPGAKVAVPVWTFKGNSLNQSTTLATAEANPNYGSLGALSATCQTPGSSVFFAARYYYAFYSIPPGDGYEAGSWTFGWSAWSTDRNCGSVTPTHAQALIPVSSGSIKIALQQEFRAYATAAGMTNSDLVYINLVDFTAAPLYFPGW